MALPTVAILHAKMKAPITGGASVTVTLNATAIHASLRLLLLLALRYSHDAVIPAWRFLKINVNDPFLAHM